MAGKQTTRGRYAYEPDYVTEPGDILQETIDGLGMSQKELASRTGYTTKHINLLISGKARITPEAALRLEKVTQVPAHFWNNLETQFQERKARLAANSCDEEQLDWLDEIPWKELVKRGVIPRQEERVATIGDALAFFGVASVDLWRSGWSKTQVAFRKAAGAEKCTGIIASWVRLAELKAKATPCPPYDPSRFQAALKQIRQLTVTSPDHFVPKMHQLCAEAGVAFVLVPEIPGGRVSGAARWQAPEKAMIAVNLRGKRNDLFWFTFFHEAGHILNDSREQVYVDVDYANDPCERSANQFAREMLIPKKYETELRRLKSKSDVLAFAVKAGIHPGIVAGRLRHEKLIPHNFMHGLFEKFEWANG